MTADAPLQLWRETVLPEWCDYNGHMNLAYYVLIFDHATDAFYDFAGLDRAYREETGNSTFVVESHITYDREVLQGAEVYCTTQLLDFDDKRIHFFHRMYHAAEDFLAATTEIMGVHIDLGIRRVAPMPDGIQRKLADVLTAHNQFPRPDQVGRVMEIRRRQPG